MKLEAKKHLAFGEVILEEDEINSSSREGSVDSKSLKVRDISQKKSSPNQHRMPPVFVVTPISPYDSGDPENKSDPNQPGPAFVVTTTKSPYDCEDADINNDSAAGSYIAQSAQLNYL